MHVIWQATTVGYGDISVTLNKTRFFSGIHLLVSVALLAALITDIGILGEECRRQMKKYAEARAMLDRDLILSLDEDGNGLDKYEFVVGLLVKLEMVDKGNAKSFSELFDALDNDGSGKLSTVELNLMVDRWQKAYDDQIAEHAKQPTIASSMVGVVGEGVHAVRRGSLTRVAMVGATSTTTGAEHFVKNVTDGMTTVSNTTNAASDLVRQAAATRLQRAQRRKVAPESGRRAMPQGKAAAYYRSRVSGPEGEGLGRGAVDTVSRIDILS